MYFLMRQQPRILNTKLREVGAAATIQPHAYFLPPDRPSLLKKDKMRITHDHTHNGMHLFLEAAK